MNAERQCPACGVFVDKVTDEFLIRKRILQQERGAMEFRQTKEARDSEKQVRAALEASIREQVRRELEAEFGIDRESNRQGARTRQALVVLAVVAVGAAAFAGGQWRAGKAAEAALAAQAAQAEMAARPAQDVDKMLAQIGSASDGSAPGPDDAGPVSEDSLMPGPGGRGGKTLTVEQAVAASQTLAGSIGYKSGEGAAAGAGGARAAPGASAGGAGPSGEPEAAVAPRHKLQLTLALARTLAETGQLARSREVLRAIRANPAAGEGDIAPGIRLLEVEIAAWSVGEARAEQQRTRIEALRQQVQALPSPAERAVALARAGAVLSHHENLPGEGPKAFLVLARDALAGVPDPALRAQASGEFLVALGETLLQDTRRHLARGEWARGRAAAAEMASLMNQASSPEVSARLMALDLQARQLTSGQDAALARLTEAGTRLAKEPSAAAQAMQLRSLAAVPGVARDARFAALVDRVAAVAEGKQGPARSTALVQLALLWADQGLDDRFEDLRRRALETQGLSPADRVQVTADLLVLGELSALRRLSAVPSPAEAEARLRKVAGYLM